MEKETKERRPIYKKWWFWLIIVLVIVAIGGNMGDSEEENDPTNETIAQQDEVDTEEQEKVEPNKEEPEEIEPEEKGSEYGINDKVEFEGRVLEVTNVEQSNGTDFDKPKDGKEYVIVHVTIENNSDEEVSYNPYDFKMQNSQGQIESKTFTIVDSDTALSSGDLAPGGKVSGTMTWEQPVDDDELKLIFEPSLWSKRRVTINLN